jgi:hypothetical protein
MRSVFLEFFDVAVCTTFVQSEVTVIITRVGALSPAFHR